jgi:hypothetical protein
MIKGPLTYAKETNTEPTFYKRSKGLGDTIERITETTGIKKMVKKVVGDDCGCKERKEKLNKLFPYKEKKDV